MVYDPRGGFHSSDLEFLDYQTHTTENGQLVPNEAFGRSGIIMDFDNAYKAEIQNGVARQTRVHKWNSLSCEW